MSAENQSMFPGEDGEGIPAAYPELPPGMVANAGGSLYTPPKRCQNGRPHLEAWQADEEKFAAMFRGLTTDPAERKRLQLWTFIMEYFPDAFLAVLDVSIKGNDQHNPGQPLHWAREKSQDQMNTAFRHMWDYGRGVKRDTDGCWHLAKAIWRLSAELQLEIEAEQNGVNRS